DATGKEQVYIHAQKNMNTEVLNNRTTDVINNHAESIGNNQMIAVTNNQIQTVGVIRLSPHLYLATNSAQGPWWILGWSE
ncbi:bacteriophage T4 gp5 trimerisation domain-containing protein, partial [Escherichia coli]|uniref:bacteriophage T4 gp5 trimerisation domain-containing protein n=1 Tax=Escherichia coli TaxID=562 RepID=UPI00389246CB